MLDFCKRYAKNELKNAFFPCKNAKRCHTGKVPHSMRCLALKWAPARKGKWMCPPQSGAVKCRAPQRWGSVPPKSGSAQGATTFRFSHWTNLTLNQLLIQGFQKSSMGISHLTSIFFIEAVGIQHDEGCSQLLLEKCETQLGLLNGNMRLMDLTMRSSLQSFLPWSLACMMFLMVSNLSSGVEVNAIEIGQRPWEAMKEALAICWRFSSIKSWMDCGTKPPS